MEITQDLLERYAKGTCTDEEAAAVQAWLGSAEDDDAELYAPQFAPYRHRVWQTLQQRFLEPVAQVSVKTQTKGILYVSSDTNSSVEVVADACEIILDGGIQLRNASAFAREVTCNGKTFIIQPRQQYVIFSHTELGAHLLAPEAYYNEAELYRYFKPNTTFKVCV